MNIGDYRLRYYHMQERNREVVEHRIAKVVETINVQPTADKFAMMLLSRCWLAQST